MKSDGSAGPSAAGAVRSEIIVLGMHRSGTSAVTGFLRLCGAWVGDEEVLTGSNDENPKGFWERRDIRDICDALLHSANADWWKVGDFDTGNIPAEMIVEQQNRFRDVASELDRHGTWVLKEPRLCLLFPLLRPSMKDPVCIHIYRHPVEVARSLQARNGFGLSEGLALWEAYTLAALRASAGRPRMLVSYEKLACGDHSEARRIVEQLQAMGVSGLQVPDQAAIDAFLTPDLHRQKATGDGTLEYMLPSQRQLWNQLESGDALAIEPAEGLSHVSLQHLRDLEARMDLQRPIADLHTIKREAAVAAARLVIAQSQLKERQRQLLAMKNSTSWRVTKPVRVLTLLARKFGTFSKQKTLALRARAKRYVSMSARATFALKQRMREAEAVTSARNWPEASRQWKLVLAAAEDRSDVSGLARANISIISRLSSLEKYKNNIAKYNEIRPKKKSVAIYTAISSGYDTLKLPKTIDGDIDYFVFTDTPFPDTGVWKVAPMPYQHADPTRSARFVKTHPHLLFQGYDIAVWIDSNIMILNDIQPLIKAFKASGKIVGAVPHPLRKSVYEEAAACIERAKDDDNLISRQIELYRAEEFEHDDLIESNLMMFDLRDDRTGLFCDAWWTQIDRHSRRDQLSLNYALRNTGTDWHPLTRHPDSVRNHPDFALVRHDSGTGLAGLLVDALEAPMVDPYQGASYATVREERIAAQKSRPIDIVMCVHNALDDVRICAESVERHRDGDNQRLIIVDDGSGEETADYLAAFAEGRPWVKLLRNDAPSGYTKAANQGMAASTAEFVILLNSDTIVTDGWAEKMADAVFSTPGAGLVGPMSNAASHQSIPEHRSTKGQTAINDLPPGLTPEDMNRLCEEWTVAGLIPRVPLVHGFCFGITRSLIKTIGLFDDENFPRGYGEENDYCFRAVDAGFGLVVATHTFVFHAKSKSYSDPQRRMALMKAGNDMLADLHGRERVRRAVISMQQNPFLVRMRDLASTLWT